MEQASGIQWNTLTWYSKLLAILSFIALVCSAFYFGIWYEKTVYIPNQKPDLTETFISPQRILQEQIRDMTPEQLIKEYQQSKFKIVRIIPFPFSNPHYDALYVVAARGINDSGCGSAYGSQTCYFFLESTYAEMPPMQYVGSWEDGIIGFGNGKFKNEHTLSFTASGNDGGMGVYETWELNILTGSTTRFAHVVTDSQ